MRLTTREKYVAAWYKTRDHVLVAFSYGMWESKSEIERIKKKARGLWWSLGEPFMMFVSFDPNGRRR